MAREGHGGPVCACTVHHNRHQTDMQPTCTTTGPSVLEVPSRVQLSTFEPSLRATGHIHVVESFQTVKPAWASQCLIRAPSMTTYYNRILINSYSDPTPNYIYKPKPNNVHSAGPGPCPNPMPDPNPSMIMSRSAMHGHHRTCIGHAHEQVCHRYSCSDERQQGSVTAGL